MNVAVFSSSLATHLFLLSAEAGISAVYVRPSGLQDRSCRLVMVPASLFLNMWALSRLWPVRSFMTTTCCHRSRKWKSSLSEHCPRAALMRVFFSRKVTLLSCCPPLAPSLASSSAFFTSWKTTVSRYPLQDYSSAVLRDIMKAFCETKEFVSCCSYQD